MSSLVRASQNRSFSILRTLYKSSAENAPQITTEIDEVTKKERVTINPIVRHNENIDTKRARLVYQSRKRGILETDLLLAGFAKKYLHKFNAEELEEYDKLLDHLDWDIYYWATRNYDVTPLPKQWENSKILKLLQEHSENKEKDILRMPNLF
jgi:succinate dehydrogenase assembly factor 2